MGKFLLQQIICISLGVIGSEIFCWFVFKESYVATTLLILFSGSLLEFHKKFHKHTS